MHPKLVNVINKLVESLKQYKWYSIGELICSENSIYFTIEIGSKTGTGNLYYDEESDSILLETRYGGIDTINEDDPMGDIATVAWWWYLDYKDRGYGINEKWVPIWEQMGLIKKEVKTVTVVEYHIN